MSIRFSVRRVNFTLITAAIFHFSLTPRLLAADHYVGPVTTLGSCLGESSSGQLSHTSGLSYEGATDRKRAIPPTTFIDVLTWPLYVLFDQYSLAFRMGELKCEDHRLGEFALRLQGGLEAGFTNTYSLSNDLNWLWTLGFGGYSSEISGQLFEKKSINIFIPHLASGIQYQIADNFFLFSGISYRYFKVDTDVNLIQENSRVTMDPLHVGGIDLKGIFRF